ncbi:MAG: N-acetylglucosamine-6-phosphate deacetylase [bacterium]
MFQKLNKILKEYKITNNKKKLFKNLNRHKSNFFWTYALKGLLGENIAKIESNSNENKLTLILNGTIINAFEVAQKNNILIFNDRIVAIGENLPDYIENEAVALDIIDAEGLIITAGLIDQHIHGGFGVNFNNCSSEEVLSILNKYPKYGITSVVPTIMTDEKEAVKNQIEIIKAAKNSAIKHQTNLIGIHLEGPFLNSKNKGIHPENCIETPTVENFKFFEDAIIKIVTFAPELDEDFKLTKYLYSKDIIPSGGHSKATESIVNDAERFGMSQLTHIFNAMSPLHHRTPGIIGEGLVNDDLYVEVIPDGLHLHKIILEIIFRTKPQNKIIFISDSLPLTLAEKESIIFGGQAIFNKENKALNQDGTFAGSLIFLDSALRTLSNDNIEKFAKLIAYATSNPAKNLGLHNKGSIHVGKDADIVLWNQKENFEIVKTFIHGEIAYQK